VGASHPLQAGAAAFVSADRDELTPWFRQRRDQVTAGLVAAGLRLREPEGGWFAFADAAGLGWSSGELTRRLVTEAGVVLAPGTAFFADPGDGDGWVRVALVRDEAVTADALGRIAGFLRSATPADPVRRNSVEQPWPASR
jgi:aminotransferase